MLSINKLYYAALGLIEATFFIIKSLLFVVYTRGLFTNSRLVSYALANFSLSSII